MNIKKSLLSFSFAFVAFFASAQQADPVLMVVDGKPVYRSEFEYIYNKNNNLNSVEKKDVKDYLRLFTDFKLKIAEAERLGIDTVPSFKREYMGYRSQLSRNYLTDTVVDIQAARRYYDRMDSLNHVSAVRMKHLFFYLPQSISRSELRKKTVKMDSLYHQLQADPTLLDALVDMYSDDKRTLNISYLQTPESFEQRVFSLEDGELSEPFFSPQGLHIVKVLEHKALPSFEKMKGDLVYRLSRINGVSPGTLAVVERLKQEYKYTLLEEGYAELTQQGFTEKNIFKIGEETFNGKAFAVFARMFRRPSPEVFDLFVTKSVLDYENERLETKYPEFRLLMQEYKEGMMLFERSNKEIWERAANDSIGLQAYFTSHIKNYKWNEPHFKGVVLHSKDKKLFKEARRLLKNKPMEEWATFLMEYFNADGVQRVQVEDGLFELGDNLYVDELAFCGAKAEPMEDFAYVKLFGKKVKYPESYKEVKGEVLSDYQKFLEDLWIQRLRSEIKVEIKEEVIKTVNNH